MNKNADGYSLLEVLIGSAIFLMVTIGVAPLFARAVTDNHSARESTDASNMVKSRLEEMMQLPFLSEKLTLEDGTERQYLEYFSLADRIWRDGAPPTSDPALWLRTTTIRQYGFDHDPLSGEAVQLKEIEVRVQGAARGGPLHPSRDMVARVFKSH